MLLLTSHDLLGVRRWEHRIRDGRASTELVLAGGRCLDDARIGGVLNRLSWIPPAMFAAAQQDDRDYASEEVFALLLSWLHGLPAPVLNRPTPAGLGGRWRHASEWAVLAARSGLPARRVRVTTAGGEPPMPQRDPACRSVVVVDGEVVGAPDGAAVVDGCRRLAVAAATQMLGVDLVMHEGRWHFAAATPLPDLVAAGPAVLDAVATAMRMPELARR